MNHLLRYSVKYGALELSATVHRGVGEGVGVEVLLAWDVGERDCAESGRHLRKARLLFSEDRMTHFI